MNIEKNLIDRIENRLTETKNPCKLYKDRRNAETVAEKLAERGAEHFGLIRSANYIIVFIPSVQKFAVGFDINELTNRPDAKGGYVGLFADAGHYSY